MDKVLTLLKKIKIFENVSDTALLCMLSDDGVCRITAEKGKSISQTDKSLMIMLSGTAYAQNGSAVLRTFSKGDIFGIATLFSEKGAESEIIAKSECTLLKIPESAVRNLLREDENATINYIRFLTDRIHFLNGLIDVYTGRDSADSLSVYLLRMSAQKGDTFTLNMSATAKELNIGRASLYRALDRLVADGTVAKDGKNITIINKERLKEYI